MKKKRLLLLVFITSIFINPLIVTALDYPEVNSQIVEIYDLDNKEIVYEKESNKQAPIASLTKIVTTITAIETIPNLDEEVTITNEILSTVQWDASIAGLKAGDKVTYRDLLYASMLPSGADATNSIAILSSGSIDNFVKKMNDLTSKLKLKNTHFVNVTGLDEEGHYSSANDIRIILEYALKNELFKKIYTEKKYTLKSGLEVKSTLFKYNVSNTIDTSKILGSKTGYTGNAGYCLSTLSNINSHEFIIIVLNAEHRDNKYYNIVDTVDYINFLLENYKNQILVHKKDIIKTIPVELSKKESYKVKAKKDVLLYLPSDYDKNKLDIKYEGLEKLSFLNKKGKKIGTVSYYYNDKKIAKEDVILNDKIEISIQKILKKYILLIIGFIILLLFIIKRKKKKNKKKRKNK